MNGIFRTLIITLLAITNAQAMRNLRVDDTVNLSKNYSGEVIVSDIFNGFNGSHVIKKHNGDRYNYEISYQTCTLFESLKAHFYPKVYIEKELSSDASSKYGIVNICKTFNVHSLDIKLMDDAFFLEVADDGPYSIWMNETVVYRLKRDNKTHYVSSVSTGTCIIQISINNAVKCENIDQNAPDKAADFFRTLIYRSSIKTTDVNRQLEGAINEYYFLNDLDYSLFTFPNVEHVHQKKILSQFEKKNIVSLILKPLPELPAVSEFQSHENPLPLTNLKQRDHITPGDGIFNLDEVLMNRSRLVTTKNFLMNTNNGFTPSFATYSYSNCRTHTENEAPKLENGKLNVFEEILKRQNYRIDPKNFNPQTTCMKLTVCSGFKIHKLEFLPMAVIKLNDNSKNNIKYNVFERENITLWFSNGDEMHFVTGTEKGECLSQMLILPDEADTYREESILHDDPLLNGEIISATRNRTLEERIRIFLNNDLRRIIRPQEMKINEVLETFAILERSSLINSALINLYLVELN
ncbi:uncharacterized protein LOC141535861 [Cotesia typhae]|uniref:uncharacterized protein LOC141535861 n=1 Tax=Cotesia typhae TaxID=2053667 RepID=UPI003D697DE9